MINNLTDIQNSNILLVDDNAENLAVIHKILSNYDFNVMMAQSGNDALDIANSNDIDLILLDIKLPDIDGYEVCRKLKDNKATEDTPVLFISILSETKDKIMGFASGGVDYITKPFNSEEVLARIVTHLTIKSQREQLKKLNQEKNKIFSIISHDLRGPLSAAYKLTQLINNKIMSFESEDFTETISLLSTTTKELYLMMENLLDWSIFKSHDINHTKKMIVPSKLINDTINQLSLLLKEKNISTINNISDELSIFYNDKSFAVIIRNLLSNSIKFSKEGGLIQFDFYDDGKNFIFQIKDNGVGMEVEQLESLALEKTGESTFGTGGEIGKGMGMKLCRDFVEFYGGKLIIETQKDQFTTVSFTIPKK